MKRFFYTFIVLAAFISSCDKKSTSSGEMLQLTTARAGQQSLSAGTTNTVQPVSEVSIVFSEAIDPTTAADITFVGLPSGVEVPFSIDVTTAIVTLTFSTPLEEGSSYQLTLPPTITGLDGSTFGGIVYALETTTAPLTVVSITADDVPLTTGQANVEVSINPIIRLTLSHDIEPSILEENTFLTSDKSYDLTATRLSPATYELRATEPLADFSRTSLLLSSAIGTDAGRAFTTNAYQLYTALDGIPDFPLISDEELLTKVQEQTFNYFYDFAHPNSGLARERNTSGNTVTTGGSGFGIMALIVGVERGFITRDQAVARWQRIVNFLETADRFHGVWPHWLDGNTGTVRPFSQTDDGGDIVETAFLIQGLLTVRQYLDPSNTTEADLASKITKLWEEVEWSWYTKGDEKQLYWHWSPNFGWDINLRVSGHNETQIIYILAAASPTYPIDIETYENGYARNGGMQNGNTLYGTLLPLGNNGPLFFTHYSYLGLDPRNLQDKYANYWQQNEAHTLINRAYCIDNPRDYVGYSEDCWGLTASDGDTGYSAHSPNNDRGVITPTAAISSIPFTPEESMAAIRHFYYDLGSRLWGEYGFYDAFNPTAGWVASSYLAIDQGPIVCMIENHRTALLWDLFMQDEEVLAGLDKLEFTY